MIIKRLLGGILIVPVLAIIFSCGQNEETTDRRKVSEEQQAATTQALEKMALVGVEKQLVDTLIDLWQDKSNVASVDQAAAMIGVEATDSMRLELLGKFNENLTLSRRLSRYRAYTFILTNEEKLLAQYLVNYEKRAAGFPPPDSVMVVLGISTDQLKGRLDFLVQVGFLFDLGGPDKYNPLGYSYGSKVEDVKFDLGINFHAFYVEDDPPFNVGCAKEALFKLMGDFPDRSVRYETVDPFSLEPVVVEYNSGEIVSVSPEGAVILEGGFCGANNLFTIREHAVTWVKTISYVRDPQIHDIRARFDELKAQFGVGSGE